MKYRSFERLKLAKVCQRHIYYTKKKGTTGLLNLVYAYGQDRVIGTFDGEEVRA